MTGKQPSDGRLFSSSKTISWHEAIFKIWRHFFLACIFINGCIVEFSKGCKVQKKITSTSISCSNQKKSFSLLMFLVLSLIPYWLHVCLCCSKVFFFKQGRILALTYRYQYQLEYFMAIVSFYTFIYDIEEIHTFFLFLNMTNFLIPQHKIKG